MRRVLFVLATLATAVSAVRADLSSDIGSSGQYALTYPSDASPSQTLRAVTGWHVLSSDIDASLSQRASADQSAAVPGQLPAAPRQPGGSLPSDKYKIIQLPPPPGSDRLAYTGLLTVLMGATLRSARHLRFGALPAWLHTAGPDQVGHRVALDWDPGDPLPACRFDTPSDAQRCPVYREWVVCPPFLPHSRLDPVVADPRAPPR
jgi:hypothetical protein